MAEYCPTPAADTTLKKSGFTLRQWGAEQANHYIDTLTAAFSELARSPKTAPACDPIRPGYRRRSVERHTVYFRITAYGIAIVRILHDRMDAPRHF